MKTGARYRALRAVDGRHRAAAGRRAVLPELVRRRRQGRDARSARSPSRWSTRASTGAGRRRARRRSRSAGVRRSGFLPYDWKGYNEAMILYLLALGSPTRRSPPTPGRLDQHLRRQLGEIHGHEHLGFAPLFGHQYSHVWIDFRGIRDEYMRARGIDYFENCRRATYAQRAYADANPLRLARLRRDVWGITASDGPADATLTYRRQHATLPQLRGARRRRLHDPRRRHAGADRGDGVAAVCARAGDSGGARRCTRSYGDDLYSKYGFLDAFNPSFDYRRAAAPRQGRAGRRLVRHRLPRHRSGPDPGDDRRTTADGWSGKSMRAQSALSARAEARRLHAAAGSTSSAPWRRRRRASRARRGAAPLLARSLARRLHQRVAPRRRCASGRWAAKARSSHELLDDFGREHPGLELRMRSCRGARRTRSCSTAFAGDATPDVAQIGNTWLPELAALDALEPLQPVARRNASIAARPLRRHLGHQRHRRQARRRVVVRRHAAAILPTRPAARSRLRAHAARRGSSGARRWQH